MALVDIGGLRLNVTTAGEGERTLVLIHGNLASADWFEPCLPYLTRHFRTVGIEWRGCGRSDKPPPAADFADYSPRQHALDIMQVLHRLGIDRCDLIGHSTGAIINNYLVCDEPERFRRVVCLDPVPPQSLPFDAKAQAFFAMAQQHLPLARWSLATAASSLFAADSLARPGEPVFRAAVPDERRQLFERVVRQAFAASPGIWLGTPATLDRLHAANDLVPRMTGATHPHLVVHGREDRIIPLPAVTAIPSIIRSAEIRLLDGIGHSPNIEAPETFCALALDFLLRP